MSKTKKPAPKAKAKIIQADASEHVAGKFMQVDLKLIDPSKTNPRKHFDEAALKDLAESIGKRGVLSPILVRPAGKRYELVAGERRFRASKLAGLKDIPARVADLDDKAVLEVQVIENLQRTDLSPMEEATSYEELINKHGYTADQLASKIGKSASYVYKRMQLTTLCDEVRKDLISGTLHLGYALIIARIADHNLQKLALRRCKDYGLSTDSLRSWIDDQVMTSLKSAPFSLTDADLLPIAGACSACPKNTGAAKELFDDFKPGANCMSPSCYSSKITKWWQKQMAEAKERGQEALSRTESEKLFTGYYRDTPNPERGYVLPSQKCELHPKQETWSKIVGNRLTPILAIGKNRKPIKLYRMTDLKKLIKDEKWAKGKKADELRGTAKSRSPQRDWELERKIDRAVEDRVLHLLTPTITKLSEVEFLQASIAESLQNCDLERLLTWLQLEPTGSWKEKTERARAYVYSTTAAPYLRMIALNVWNWDLDEAPSPYLRMIALNVWNWDLDEAPLATLIKEAGIDPKALRKEIAPIVKEQHKAAKGAKPEPVAESEDDFEDVDEEIAELEEVEE